ncbi:MAG: hypothetical protein UV89_C0026G0008 [candidate division WWE3 bacterium GW2011_GWB2_43_22]|uniref:Uncharacterized protein n=1 Tax=candidate division WWE3 bacterium GW2011_GWB2_43_22 TaxID=1619118 RepID=A0A0G1EJE7_UNCKA|nr:MAG: hypothetical protein UV89_C0026G0008 [candidate division WWE3 bacterium GW2011_GWB2_43_22]
MVGIGVKPGLSSPAYYEIEAGCLSKISFGVVTKLISIRKVLATEKIKGYDPGGTASYTPAHSIRNVNVPLGSHPLMAKYYQKVIGLSNLPKLKKSCEGSHESSWSFHRVLSIPSR